MHCKRVQRKAHMPCILIFKPYLTNKLLNNMYYISTFKNEYAFITTWKAKLKFKFSDSLQLCIKVSRFREDNLVLGSLSPTSSSARDHNRFPSYACKHPAKLHSQHPENSCSWVPYFPQGCTSQLYSQSQERGHWQKYHFSIRKVLKSSVQDLDFQVSRAFSREI